jgi:polar amino acid transport system substrate-binding protein
MIRTRGLRLLSAAAVLSLVVAACGDDESSGNAGTDTTAAASASSAPASSSAPAPDSTGAPAEAVSEALEGLRDAGSVDVALFIEEPTSILAPDGSVSGIVPDVATEAFKRLGVDQVNGTVLDFSALIPAIQAGQFTLGASAFVYTEERCDAIAFTDPIMGFQYMWVVPKGNPKGVSDLASIKDQGLVQAVTEGSYPLTVAEEQGLEVLQVPGVPEMLSAVESGRADLTALFDVTINADPTIRDKFDVIPVTDGLDPVIIGGVFSQDNAELRDEFNRELAAMGADGSLAAILEQYGADATAVVGKTRQDFVPGCF